MKAFTIKTFKICFTDSRMLEASIVLSMGIMLKFDFFSQKILGSHVIVVQGLTIW